jgi:hypothetical protein
MSHQSLELHIEKSAMESFDAHYSRRGMSIEEGVNELINSYNDTIESRSVNIESEGFEKFSVYCQQLGMTPTTMLYKLIQDRVYRHNLNQKMLELQATEDKDRQYVFKVPANLLDRYSKICQAKDIPIARGLRHFIREEVARHEISQDQEGA